MLFVCFMTLSEKKNYVSVKNYYFLFACFFSCNGLAVFGGPFRTGLGFKRVNGWLFISSLGCINVILFSSTIEELNLRCYSFYKDFKKLT